MQPVNRPELDRQIGVGPLAVNTMNVTIGTGIFILPAFVAAYLGSMSFLAYLFCSLLVGLIMMCFAELGSKPTSSGGAYGMIEHAFGPLAGFTANSLFWFGFSTLSNAAIMNAMADMLAIWFPVFTQYWFRTIFMFTVIALIAVMNIRGVRSGSLMVNILTTLKITPLLLLVIVGFFGIKSENLGLVDLPDISNFGTACLLLFFAFGGTESALNISGEIKNPGKTVPKGIFLGVTGILVTYLLVQFVATGVLGPDLASYTEAPLAETATRLIGPVGGTIIIGTTVVSIYGVVAGDILATSRLPFVAARDGLLPDVLSRVHPRFKSPYIAIGMYCSMIFLMAISSGFEKLAILSSSAILVIYLGVVLAMIKGRFKPDIDNPPMFKAPGGLIVPVLALVVLGWLLYYVPVNDFKAMGAFIILTTAFYFAFAWLKRSRKTRQD